ncbi:small subunit ribosomal protein S14 [Halohasta litchfieldiae]|jgi:small subunit ribosomal protein S14|uniref:Small ribosomal subunit protein uS14 n=1 Tax=Halohasta litchfieldiae TaxID=1073996 RepID=A0A1H6X122_9EURY|nr:30S ribosomal protein S14 [Halohasta litchfieldiae]ATW90075.1 small subunit ribosomal protein S14 [Halohasta litchfieldiae]SEJ21254.1 SSU ribosomal protein S14P [Halohasta litchfieldiae]
MSESETDQTSGDNAERTGQQLSCRRCDRKQGLVGKYDINLCRQCFREVARDMGFKKYS